jgi:predicted GNAT family acetyltransferase
VHIYLAKLDGQPASCVVASDYGESCSIDLLATVPEARGRGLGAALVVQALSDAMRRGRRASTVISSPMGRPVYKRLGYRELGSLERWLCEAP